MRTTTATDEAPSPSAARTPDDGKASASPGGDSIDSDGSSSSATDGDMDLEGGSGDDDDDDDDSESSDDDGDTDDDEEDDDDDGSDDDEEGDDDDDDDGESRNDAGDDDDDADDDGGMTYSAKPRTTTKSAAASSGPARTALGGSASASLGGVGGSTEVVVVAGTLDKDVTAKGRRLIAHLARGGGGGRTLRNLIRAWGPTNGMALWNVLNTRSKATRSSAQRAAYRMRQVDSPIDAKNVNTYIDSWAASAIARATGAIGTRTTAAAPTSVGKEFGALAAHVTRMFPGWEFPLMEAARDKCGCNDRKKPGKTSGQRLGVSPAHTRAVLAEMHPVNAFESMQMAATATASSMGLPVGLTASIRTDEVQVLTDTPSGRSAIAFGVTPRAVGRKVLRARAVAGTQEHPWTGSACVLVHEYVVPWVRVAQARKWTHLFPLMSWRVGRYNIRPDSHVSKGSLQRFVSSFSSRLGRTVQFHDLRRGLEKAMDLVHTLPTEPGAAPRARVTTEVKNAVCLRSNKAEKGSRVSYTLDVLDDLFDATRSVHLVDIATVGGFLRGPRVGDAPASASAASASGTTKDKTKSAPTPETGSCATCRKWLGEEDAGTWCENVACSYLLCTACHDPSVDLYCPAHPKE